VCLGWKTSCKPLPQLVIRKEAHVERAAHYNLGLLLYKKGQVKDAIPYYREAVKVHPFPAAMTNLAYSLAEDGQLDEAVAVYREAIIHFPQAEPVYRAELREVLRRSGQPDDDISHFAAMAKLRIARFGSQHPSARNGMIALALAYQYAGRPGEAIPLLEEDLKLAQDQDGPEHPNTLSAMHNLGSAYSEAGRLADALSLLQGLLKLRRTHLGPDHPDTLNTMRFLGSVLLKHKAYASAEPIVREFLALSEEKMPNTYQMFQGKWLLGRSLLGQKKYRDAELLLLEGYEGMKRHETTLLARSLWPVSAPAYLKGGMIKNLQQIIEIYEASGQREQAANWRAKLDQIKREEQGSNK
jgi:tetratricopeptide (TPR) repeat protein